MKKILFLYISIWFVNILPAQQNLTGSDLVHERDSVFRLYRLHTDTMSINTWVNIMTAYKYLKTISGLDSLIALQNKNPVPVQNDSLFAALKNRNAILDNQLKDSYDQLAQLRYERENRANIILYGSILAVAIFLILIIVIIVLANKSRKNSAAADKFKSMQTRLYFAEEELQRVKINQQSEGSDKIDQLQEELTLLNEKNESLSDEKLMLENQIIEVKKAWEMEVQKRMDAELTGGGPDKRTEKKLQRRINALETENAQLIEKIENQQKLLSNQDEKLEVLSKQIDDLTSSTEQNSSGSVDDNKETTSDLKAEYDDLFRTNKELTASLAETKKNYENEVKTRLEIEAELRELLERLRNKYL